MPLRPLLLAFAVLAALSLQGAAAAGNTTYEISADLDVARAYLDATQRTTYTNRTGQTLSDLAFDVTAAHFGAFALGSARVDGQTAQTSLDGVVLDVKLPAPLAPGASATVELAYAVDIPAPGTNRLGSAGGIIAIGNWYPVLYPFRDGRWLTHQYTKIGDAFFTESGDYDVTLRTSKPVVVASTGQVVSRDGNTRRIRLDNARDFAMAVSEDYETSAVTVDGITITAYYLPQHRAAAAAYLGTGAEMAPWLQSNLGRYPWRTLDIAETWSDDPNDVGQEYPGIVFISSGATAPGGGMGSYLSYLVAHEVTHQWFYGVVGDDQIREPWLDEAFATYLPERFYAERYPGIAASRWATFRARLADETSRLGPRPVDQGVFDFGDEGVYFAVVYRRGAAFLDELRQTLGDDRFFQLLRDFVAREQFGVAKGSELLGMAQGAAGSDLSALFGRYFARTAPEATSQCFRETGYCVSGQFLSEFRRLGGVDALGYPASNPFDWEGFRVQVFQRFILQWHPECSCGMFVNVFDRLNVMGKDDWLLAARMTPRHHVTSLAVLDPWPALKAKYDPAFGVPTSDVEDMGPAYVVRLQRAVLQQWKEDVPWAKKGQVTVALGGDIAKEAGVLPLP